PGERIEAKVVKQHKRYDEALTQKIIAPCAQRIAPQCAHFDVCGACQLQHFDAQAQRDSKRDAVLALLQKMAKITPHNIHSTLYDQSFHYRRSARIGVNQRSHSGESIVGFRRRNSAKLFQVDNCPVLPAHMAPAFDTLRSELEKIDNAKAITHIEYIQGDNQGALTFRTVQALHSQSKQILNGIGEKLGLQIFIRTDDALLPLGDADPMHYNIDNLQLSFEPGDFIQVNAAVNRQMITRALQWLEIAPGDRVLDLFCGLGNFSLPLASAGATVVGVEGSQRMVQRATQNALDNALHNCHFYAADLNTDIRRQSWYGEGFNKLLLDPPRSGASELIPHLANYHAEKILYVACDPASLARDSAQLGELGYTMTQFCTMDMFPNTAHVESMALFSREAKA
ncbi:MAG: 23S rRNA (uracil(1939)-C(5))-methyltransferase RlmD, partial [Pseudomonadales bacterium]